MGQEKGQGIISRTNLSTPGWERVLMNLPGLQLRGQDDGLSPGDAGSQPGGGKTRERKSPEHLLAARGEKGIKDRSKAASSTLLTCRQPGGCCDSDHSLDRFSVPWLTWSGAEGCLLQAEVAAWGTRARTRCCLFSLLWASSSLEPNGPWEGCPSPGSVPLQRALRAVAKFPT